MVLPVGIKSCHFIGIGGYGMSALAQLLISKGLEVSGSDLKESVFTEKLTAMGARVDIGHKADNIYGTELVIYSTAIDKNNPEMKAATEKGLPIWHRSELLAYLLNSHYGIAVAGAHGKTTASAMVALLLTGGGLDPTALIGGYVPFFSSNARFGQGQYMVAEADESDGSFTRYYPRVALVTNIEADHLEHYSNDFSSLKQAYAEFLSHLPADGKAVLCYDDPYLPVLAASCGKNIISYSINENLKEIADYSAVNIILQGTGSSFDLQHKGKTVLKGIELAVPGRHNVANATGALAVAAALNLNLKKCFKMLNRFSGVSRRFEIVGCEKGITVVDDYAHHPTEIEVTIKTARTVTEGKVICIFQPHRYTRTASLFEDFARAFKGADEVLLHGVYSAGEKPLPGVSSESLARRISELIGKPVFVEDNMHLVEKEAAKLASEGDLLLVMGAGDITMAARNICTLLNQRLVGI